MSRLSSLDVIPLIPTLKRYARALVHDDSLAEDLVQDTLVRGIERAESFEPGRSMRSWLLSILHNLFVDGARRAQAEHRRDAAFAEVERPVSGDPELAAYLGQVEAAFAGLPDTQRAVLHLVAVEGLSYQEAAEALGVATGTIMSRLARARATLRELDNPATLDNVVPLKRERDAS